MEIQMPPHVLIWVAEILRDGIDFVLARACDTPYDWWLVEIDTGTGKETAAMLCVGATPLGPAWNAFADRCDRIEVGDGLIPCHPILVSSDL